MPPRDLLTSGATAPTAGAAVTGVRLRSARPAASSVEGAAIAEEPIAEQAGTAARDPDALGKRPMVATAMAAQASLLALATFLADRGPATGSVSRVHTPAELGRSDIDRFRCSAIADRVLPIHGGRLVFDGPPTS